MGPNPGSEEYTSIVSAFYAGVSAMEVGEDLRANAKLILVTELAPEEPAAWANLALMAMRRNELDVASEHLDRALQLESTNAEILLLAAAHARMMGNDSTQVEYLRRAVSVDSSNTHALFELIELLAADSDESRLLMSQLVNASQEIPPYCSNASSNQFLKPSWILSCWMSSVPIHGEKR